ncbi:MAG: polymer-forming cytoskeletal protein, partial [Gammaproteobacteria bacterium]
NGDVQVCSGVQIDGCIKGAVTSDNPDVVIRLSQTGSVLGEIRAPNIIINGRVDGNVYSGAHLELAENAVVHGDVRYNLMEMKVGARINGILTHDDGCTVTEDQPNDVDITALSLKSLADKWPSEGACLNDQSR